MDDQAIAALRGAVALTRSAHVHAMRISGGDAAWETVSELCSGDVRLRDGQTVHTLWLDDDAHPLADVYVTRDDDAFLLLAETRGPELTEHARGRLRVGAFLEDLDATHRILSLNGPYAWELLGRVVGPEVVGLPYLNAFHIPAGWVLRAGKTGEFGYDLVVERDAADALEARFESEGARFGLARADLGALDQCALENWFFNIRREGQLDVTPLELQLQWRTTKGRAYVGSAALAAHRRRGLRRRLVMMVCPRRVAPGDVVSLFGERVGVVVNSGYASLRGAWVALALHDVAWAAPGIDDFEVATCEGPVPSRTVTPPLPNNRSLFVNLQLHSYATRDEIVAPPLFTR